MLADELLQVLMCTDAFLKNVSVNVSGIRKFTDYFRFTDAFLENVCVNVNHVCKFTNFISKYQCL